MTNRIVFDLSTGVETIVPYTAEEEAERQAKLLEIAAQQAQQAVVEPPTKEELLAQLNALAAQIQALG